MFGSRTIKTLTALLVSMTLGALALMVLETAPAEPAAQHLAAVTGGPPAGQAGRAVGETRRAYPGHQVAQHRRARLSRRARATCRSAATS